MITASGATHPGRVRPVNEDTFLCDLTEGIFLVCDGMGGHNAGEVASSLAAEAIRSFLVRTREGDDVTWPYGIDPALSFDANRLNTAIKLANRRVFKAGESREDYTGMGTTAVVGFIVEDRFVFANVGDSRIYGLSGNSFEQLTQDDSWVAMMLGRSSVDPSTLAKHPMKHVLTNVIGARESVECRVFDRTFDQPATFLFCSDGLHGLVEPTMLEDVLRSEDAPDVLVNRLIQAALEGGGSDNITAVIVRYTPSA